MPLRAVLLRVLLSLALVLDGGGAAVAAVHVPAAPAAPAMASCHEGMAVHAALAAPAKAPAGKACCKDGQCTCAFTAVAVLLPAGMIRADAAAPTRAAHRLATGHRAPALAHPIRPPIGHA